LAATFNFRIRSHLQLRRARLTLGANQEDFMKVARIAAGAAALCVVLAGTASYASDAMAPASVGSCVDLARQVKEAINSNQQSPNLHEAQSLSAAGREFCSNQRYAEGVSRYSKALEILNVGMMTQKDAPRSQ
jgi:hypothetical protein